MTATAEHRATTIRAAARDLIRCSDDYEEQGLTGLADGFRRRAGELLAVAAEMDREGRAAAGQEVAAST
jgi:hypothetical protein